MLNYPARNILADFNIPLLHVFAFAHFINAAFPRSVALYASFVSFQFDANVSREHIDSGLTLGLEMKS